MATLGGLIHLPWMLDIHCKRKEHFNLHVPDHESVSGLKCTICCDEYISVENRTLIFHGLLLAGDYDLEVYGSRNCSSGFRSLLLDFAKGYFGECNPVI
ncbi:unnamed protein product [Dibothriocephalus latus]|uniref:Uncharacterized protein n=1 Tax=Dibothriocephalus latus TaxID=60516 RepID=A0A3P7LFU5_DIBLA|nr:unnamed protein product [Dibothriocephalus latus]